MIPEVEGALDLADRLMPEGPAVNHGDLLAQGSPECFDAAT